MMFTHPDHKSDTKSARRLLLTEQHPNTLALRLFTDSDFSHGTCILNKEGSNRIG